MNKLHSGLKKTAIKAILHCIVIGRGGTEIWKASDFLGMTQCTKKTILNELERLVSLGYLEKIEHDWRPNSKVFYYVKTGKVGIENKYSQHAYSVLKMNLKGFE